MCLTAKKRLAEPCFFLFSNLGMGPFLSYVALKKKLSRFPFGHEPIFPAEIRTQMSLKVGGCLFFLVFIPVSSCKETLGPRHHRARRWISFNPSCQSYEKPWHRQGPTQCWMPWGAVKWWATDGRMEWFCGEISNRKGWFLGDVFGGLDGNSI